MRVEDAEEYTQALGQIAAGWWRQRALGVKFGVPAALGLSIEEWSERLGGYVRLAIPERREAVAELEADGFTQTETAYEKGFPRGCQFTDLDGAIEFDGRRLVIEPKHHDGIGPCDYPDAGQLGFLRDEVSLGKTVIVLYGCGPCNSPFAVRILGQDRTADRWEDWRDWQVYPLAERRRLLKVEIDRALGLAGSEPRGGFEPSGLKEVIWPNVRLPPDAQGGAA